MCMACVHMAATNRFGPDERIGLECDMREALKMLRRRQDLGLYPKTATDDQIKAAVLGSCADTLHDYYVVYADETDARVNREGAV